MYQPAIEHLAHCGGHSLKFSNDSDTNWDAAFLKLLKATHQGKAKEINKDTTTWRANKLTEAMHEGYGKTEVELDYDSPDAEMLRQLKANVWSFSAATDWQINQDISLLLLDKNGKLRSFNEFKTEAEKVAKVYNGQHLEVEYNHAVATSQMAARWVEYQQNEDIAPNLKYSTVGDSRVREAHKALNGIIKPLKDPFWNTYYPPNDWGCRCDVQAVDGPATDLKGKALPVLRPMFRTNLAATGVLYPEGHPFFKNAPKDVLTFGQAAYKLDTSRIDKPGRVLESGMAFDKSKQFDIRYFAEYNNRRDAADVLAEHFKTDVLITPELHISDWRYGYFFEKAPVPGKLPDLKIGNDFWELKSYEKDFKIRKVGKMLHAADSQSGNVVIKLNHTVDKQRVLDQIKAFKNRKSALSQLIKVIVIDKDNKILIDYIK